MKKVGIYGGSFNPIHDGHVQLGDELVAQGLVDELWYVVSPQNPFKINQQLLADELRLELTEKALLGHKGLKVCDVELHMPRPSYMANTLSALREEHPSVEFHLVIGADNVERFPQWYKHEEIMEHHRIIVYPRPGFELGSLPKGFTLSQTSLIDISSTAIRQAIAQGTFQGEGLPPGVWQIIKDRGLYQSVTK